MSTSIWWHTFFPFPANEVNKIEDKGWMINIFFSFGVLIHSSSGWSWSHNVAKVDLKHMMIILPQPLESWAYRCAPRATMPNCKYFLKRIYGLFFLNSRYKFIFICINFISTKIYFNVICPCKFGIRLLFPQWISEQVIEPDNCIVDLFLIQVLVCVSQIASFCMVKTICDNVF